MRKAKTIGELSFEASSDTGNYSAFDIGNEMVKDIDEQVWECISRHHDQFDSDQFCVVMLLARDPLLFNMIRRKFYAWPFLPKPRTSQTVWIYNKRNDSVRMLWCLPYADTMAMLATLINVDPSYRNMQRWAKNFYTTKFWEEIRKEHGIKMLSEEEHLQVISEKAPKLVGDDISPVPTNPFDSMGFDTQEIVNP